MLRQYHLLDILYDTPEGEQQSKFLVRQPALKSFRYDADGVSMWYGVTLTATQYEVIR